MVLFDKEIAQIYDFWTTHGYYDYKKEAEIIARIIGNRKSIIELGIGTGNTAILLAKREYQVSGIDDSPYMLSILADKLKKEKLDISFKQQDLRELETDKKYDVALSAGGAFVYIQIDDNLFFDAYFSKQSEIETIFKRVFNLLNPNGLFLGNIQYHGKHFEFSLPDGTKYWFDLKEKSPKHLIKTHNFEKNGKIYLQKSYNFYRWTKNEIDDLAKKIGFQVKEFDKSKSFYIFEK